MRGGTLVDGTGAPAVPPTCACAVGRIAEVGPELVPGRRGGGRRGRRLRDARIHRVALALRRLDVVGPVVRPDARLRHHDRGDRQLRPDRRAARGRNAAVDDRAVLLHRGPARARVRAARSRGRGRRGPSTATPLGEPGGDERRRVRRAPGAADLRHGRRRVGRVPRPAPSATGWRRARRGVDRRGARLLDDLHGHRPRQPRGAEPQGRRRRVRRDLAVLARHPGTTLQFVPRFLQPEYWHGRLRPPRGAVRGARGVRATGPCFAARPGTTTERARALRARRRVAGPRRRHVGRRSAAHRATSTCTSTARSCGTACSRGTSSSTDPHADKAAPARRSRRGGPGPRRVGRLHLHAGRRSAARTLRADHSEREPRRCDAASRSPTSRPRRGAAPRPTRSPTGCSRTGSGRACAPPTSPWTTTRSSSCVRDPHTVTGVSDAGAHIQMFNGAGQPDVHAHALCARHRSC